MNAQEIISAIRATVTDLTDIIDALESGDALAAIGCADTDQAEVEVAHSQIKDEIKLYSRLDAENGSIEFDGREYSLAGQAELSNKIFNGWWGDAADGGEYQSEWCASAMGPDGYEYVVYWRFDEIKGSERAPDEYSWDDVYDVVAV